jgi:hypothetical protein
MFKNTCRVNVSGGFQIARKWRKWLWWTDIVAAQDANDLSTSVELDEESLVEVLYIKSATMHV